MTEVKRSARNPFRTSSVTPNPTGSIGSSSQVEAAVPQSATVGSDARDANTSTQDNSTASTRSEISTSISGNNARRAGANNEQESVSGLAAELAATAIDEPPEPVEPPPAYTPSADLYHGEATVEYGPVRPFQPAPPPPALPPHLSPHPTGMSQSSQFLAPQYSGFSRPPIHPNMTGSWSSYPGQSSGGMFGPPPRHPSQIGRSGEPSSPTAGRPLSEFARDFYAAGPDDGPTRRRPSLTRSDASSGPEANEPEHFERIVPPGRPSSVDSAPARPSSPRYAPPSDPPPSHVPPSSSSYGPPSEPPPPRDSDATNPTTSPTPGRPLLNKGRVLIYPAGHECRKCLNTGYKNFDPTHPCRKCWDRYSKPYGGALVYAPRSSGFQRPLPSFRPPQLRHQNSQSQPSLFSPPPSPNRLRRSCSSRIANAPVAPGAYPGTPGPPVSPGAGFAPPPAPPRPPALHPQLSYTRGPPPPGSTVVRPGDPRIGGRLCWRCGGDGTVSFLIFDVETCPICNGLGRIIQ